ncbi:MAG: AAA family ATPase [Spongiibacteraceae bacterium]
MRRIVVLNPKGGSGKTTLATNLASYYALHGQKTALMDFDNQGSSTHWLEHRPSTLPAIQSISAYKHPAGVTRNWFMRVEHGTERLITDTPAALDFRLFRETLNEAAAIVIPVLPSDIDIRAVSNCIGDLLSTTKMHWQEARIAVVANRVRRNTLIYQKLVYFLGSLKIPFIATLRDTQNYIHAAEQGCSIFDMSPQQVRQDVLSWQPLLEWIESREPPQLPQTDRNVVRRHL